MSDETPERPEVGGIVHLEHFNFEVQSHELATVFFMNGLGLTRDPYKRVDETNMGVNIGLQQFHLPRRGRDTPPFNGVIGLVVPDLPVIEARLERLTGMGRFDGTPYAWQRDGDVADVTSPFGVRLRLHAARSVVFLRPLGVAYVELPIPPGQAGAIAGYYSEVFRAPAAIAERAGEVAAAVTMGAHQFVYFCEREIEDYDQHDFHIAVYVSHYDELLESLRAQGVAGGEAREQLFFFKRMIAPRGGELVYELTHEVRGFYHPDFMRPLVNRWPIIAEPFSDQAAVMADRAKVPGLLSGGR